MSTPDENRAKTDSEPLLDAVREEAEPTGTSMRAAMEEALADSGRRPEDLTRREGGEETKKD